MYKNVERKPSGYFYWFLFNDAVSGSYNMASINRVVNDRYFANDVDGNVGSVM